MKILLHTLFILLLIPKANAQTPVVFCPPGAEWHYNFFTNFPYAWTNERIKYTGDSLINSENVKVLRHTKFFYYKNPYGTRVTAIKQNGDTVFFRSAATQHSWQILYNYAVQAGQSWTTSILEPTDLTSTIIFTVTVDSVKTIAINGMNLRTLFVNYIPVIPNSFLPAMPAQITERFGCHNFLFNYTVPPYMTNQDQSMGVLCYEDITFGLHQFTDKPCNYEFYVGLQENNMDASDVHLYPNPNNGTFWLHLPNSNAVSEAELSISELTGRIVKTLSLSPQEAQAIDLKELSNGVYLVSVTENKQLIYTSKIIKQDN